MTITPIAGPIRLTLQIAALMDTDAEQTVISEIIGSLGISMARLAVKDDDSGLETQSRDLGFLVYFSPAREESGQFCRVDRAVDLRRYWPSHERHSG